MCHGVVVGFTGSRGGMAVIQKRRFRRGLQRLREAGYDTIGLGDCVGADSEAYDVAGVLGYTRIGYPPLEGRLRAWCVYDVVHEPAGYLARDRAIVDAAGVLIATPDGPYRRGSGTWYTIKYATGRIPVVIIWPDGTVAKAARDARPGWWLCKVR